MKRLITFILSILISSSVHADFKIITGLNYSKYTISPDEGDMNWNYKKGFLAGIGFERALAGKVNLEFDLLFFQKGSKLESADFPNLKLNYNLSTVSIPLLLKIKFLDGTSPYVFGGMEFSSILSHKVKIEGEKEVDLKENTKNIDLSLGFGCGFEVEIQEYLFFFIEARYFRGQRNIISKPVEDESMKSSSVLIIIGVKS